MVLIICGSPRGEKSVTASFAVKIAKEAGEPYELFTPENSDIKPCTGCTGCFFTGHCKNESSDDLETLIKKMVKARAVILASPVYLAGVTGQLKTLLDRLSTQAHTMPLIGAAGITLAVAASNHAEYVSDYLTEMMECFGASMVAQIQVTGQKASMSAKEAGTILKNAMLPDANIPMSKRTRSLFVLNRNRFISMNKMRDRIPNMMGEADVWSKEYGNDRAEDPDEIVRIRQRERV